MFETGVGIRNPLFFVGIVENNIDPRYESRVQVRAFGVHGTKEQIPTEDLPWALVVAGNYSFNILPQQNHWVFGVFLDGRDAQQPLILGTIPTFMSDTLDPDRDGIGEHPKNEDEKAQSADSAPERVGQPACHPLATGESPHEGHPLEHEMNCIKDVKVASNPNAPNESFTSWSENATAYNAKYPHNNVYCSPDNKTTVELDSTPNAERLMIWHRGSYIQVDSNGTRTDKSYGDHQEVNDKNNMVYIGGRSSVTIMGDSHVYVDGNKIEEINGDLIQVVHGNHILGVGGQSTINASEEVQIRGAQLRMESNVSGINLKAAKGLFAETGESMHFKSGIAIFQDATNSFNMKAGDNIFIQCDSTLNLKAQNTKIESADTTGVKGNNVKIGGGVLVNIDATAVNVDDLVFLADGRAIAPDGASDATAADPSKSVEAPEPPAKSTSISSSNSGRNGPNVGTTGAASTDDQVENAEITPGPDDGLRGSSGNEPVVQDLSQLPPGVEGMDRANPTQQQIDAIYAAADAAGIPRNLYLRLIAQESNFNPNAFNRSSNATGYAQIVPATGRQPGYGVTPIQDINNPTENLRFGAEYLAAMYNETGRWDYALAAYNAGPGNVERYGGVPPFRETRNYVRNILGSGFTIE